MRRLRLLSILFICLLLTGSLAAKEKYHMVMIPNPSPTTILTMAELGLPLDDSRMIKGEGMQIPLEEAEIELLELRGINYQITIPDLEKYYGEICRQNLLNIPSQTDDDPVHMKYGSMGGFYTFQEIVMDLDSMRLLYPELCAEKVVIGYGWDEYPIYMVKISDNPELNEGEPQGLFDGLHHAREPGAYTAIIYAMWYLLENYGIDEEATYLVDNRELFFVPVVNPDGLLYNQMTNPNGGGMWRKNRRDNGGGVYGVDLNRNYSYQWGYNNSGSSPNPSSSTYRGPYAASEPETQAMIDFIDAHDIHTGMTIHTYGNHYLCAYGYANVLPEHYDVHMEYMAYAAQENGYNYGTCYQIMYSSNGRTQDWQLHEHDIINIEPEIGNSFWPSITQIIPDAAENLNCHLHLFWCAGGLVEFSSLVVEDGFLNPGESENLILTVFNKGWGTSEEIEFELSTADPYITLTASAVTVDSILKRTSADNSGDPFVAEIDTACPIGHEVEFTVTIDQGGFIRTEEVTLIVGQPDVFFEDDAESGMGNWNATGGWGLSNSNPHSGLYSFTESPYGNYSNNLTAVMTLGQPINLTGVTTAWLEFWTRWDIESNYDFGQVEVSTDGFNWTPLEGIYTQPGAGQGVQNYGEPGYEGSQASWVLEHIDLNQYTGYPALHLRFEFKSDGGVVGDGWHVDDIKLMGFTGTIIPPDVSITLEPTNPPVIIPPTGGTFEYTVELVNNDTTTVNFDAWIDVVLPDSSVYGPVVFRSNMTIPPGGIITRTMNQVVPLPAPAGEYEYRAFMGLYPATIFAEDSFNFVKEE